MMPPQGVVVVGSVNVDLILSVGRLPAAGETVAGASLSRASGGKGANQAVAAAQEGARTALVAVVGADEDGAGQLRELRVAGVDVSAVRRTAESATGTAVVLVSADGENSIVVASGANSCLGAADVEGNASLLQAAAVVIAQTEIPAQAVDLTATLTRQAGNRLVLNCAPVVRLMPATLATADPLVVNEIEAQQLLGGASGGEEIASALRECVAARSVVVTRGSRGAAVATADETFALSAPDVPVVDTTGAGDAFVGAVAAALSRGQTMRESVQLAIAAGARAVTYAGARPTSVSRNPDQHL